MVKKKGGREMNPADAHRKAQRQKEILRNKRERKFQRDAHALQADPDAIKDQLKEVLEQQDGGSHNLTLKLKQRALQGAYDTAVKKKKEEVVKALQPTDYTFTHAHGHGVLERAPEDSVYYHPTLNPSGLPPPGKPQRYRTSVQPDLPASELPLPLPPPLPAGPAPGSVPLPPPDEPPPGFRESGDVPAGGVLPPPMGPPPGMAPLQSHYGAPSGLPGSAAPAPLPPPAMPPPGQLLANTYVAPIQPPGALPRKETTISGASTVTRMSKAEMDRKVTSLVPASVRRAGDSGPKAAARMPAPVGMVPTSALRAAKPAPLPGAQSGAADQKYRDFLAEMEVLGAV